MEKLLDVQSVDLKIRGLETEAASIPAKCREWDDLVSAKGAGLASLQAEMEESKKELRHLDRQLEEKQESLAKYNAQLPLIKTNREYKAILLEIDLVEKEILGLEDMLLTRMSEIEETEAREAAETAEMARAEEEAAGEKARLEEKQKAIEESLRGTRSERESLAARVDVSLLSQYDRIRARKEGLAVAQINDESCGACFMALPPQIVNEVMGAAIRICPSCNRLLYWLNQ